ncbi:MAG: F0F1 ATP synthase subunit B [Bacteroidia bacterium]
MEIILPKLGLFFWTLVVFLTLFFLLKKMAWGPILEGLKERETSIAHSLSQAERARTEMASMQAENEKLLWEARQERDKMLKEAATMRDTIIAKAREEAVTVTTKEMEKAKQQIEAEKMKALTELKNEAGTLAINIAEKLLRSELSDKAAKQSMAQRLVSELSKN